MSLGANLAATAKAQLIAHGQLALVRRLNDTWDEDEQEWTEGSPDDHVVHMVPSKFSDVLLASGQVARGERRIMIAASELPIEPREATNTAKADIVYFGDWSVASAVKADSATSKGRVVGIDKDARYQATQVVWILRVVGDAS